VRIPTISRHSSADTAGDDRPTVVTGARTGQPSDMPPRGKATVSGPSDATTTHWFAGNKADQTADLSASDADRRAADRAATEEAAAAARADREAMSRDPDTRPPDRQDSDPVDPAVTDRTPVAAGPRPRASLLATFGLMFAVAAALLVLSGPLLGYGVGLAGLALILSLSGLRATRRRHVAGKTDALIGMVLSLAAIVVGVLALTGSLPWLGTDVQTVNTVRHWLDAQTVNRF
jgi:hypothetical protein